MICPNCKQPVQNPPVGHTWRHCKHCDGWFHWQRTSIAALALDLMETFRGEWFTQQELIDELSHRRPGLKADSITRSIRVLKSHGKGLAADREILGEGDDGNLLLGDRRQVLIECCTGELLRLRVPRIRPTR